MQPKKSVFSSRSAGQSASSTDNDFQYIPHDKTMQYLGVQVNAETTRDKSWNVTLAKLESMPILATTVPDSAAAKVITVSAAMLPAIVFTAVSEFPTMEMAHKIYSPCVVVTGSLLTSAAEVEESAVSLPRVSLRAEGEHAIGVLALAIGETGRSLRARALLRRTITAKVHGW